MLKSASLTFVVNVPVGYAKHGFQAVFATFAAMIGSNWDVMLNFAIQA